MFSSFKGPFITQLFRKKYETNEDLLKKLNKTQTYIDIEYSHPFFLGKGP